MPDNTCSVCPSTNHFIQGIKCIQCHSTCLNCNGNLDNNCLKCAPGLYLTLIDTCDPCVSDGVFIYQESCYLCDENCKKCSSVM